jgi:hypothetical protein
MPGTPGDPLSGITEYGYGGTLESGDLPFVLNPIYISDSPSGTGQTIFDTLPSGSPNTSS